MKYFVEVEGEEHEVDLLREPDGSLWAETRGKRLRCDVASLDPSRRFSILLDQRSFDVAAESPVVRKTERAASPLRLQVSGQRFDVRVEDERQRAARRIAGSRPPGPSRLLSMMPGIVRAILVQVGDAVRDGQPLLILEAMKMENELCADQAGVVAEILAQPGTPVEGGVPLIVLKPGAES